MRMSDVLAEAERIGDFGYDRLESFELARLIAAINALGGFVACISDDLPIDQAAR